MNFLRLLIVLALSACTVEIKPLPKKKKKRAAKHSQHQKAKREPSKLESEKHFQVDSAWMARYRVLEATWDYEIPEDDNIEYQNGKYRVPPVVYRHYEDMAQTPKPSPTP
jgi:hypothetical protein